MGSRHDEQSSTVLVIDDHDVARDLMTRLLTDAGHKVHSQGTPIGATRTVVRHEVKVVVIDVEMPAIRGDRLVALFRANPRFAHLGLILVSGSHEHELVAIGHQVGADAVIPKKQLEADLVNIVGRLAQRRHD
jgi:CheY-like chemotaxis protein